MTVMLMLKNKTLKSSVMVETYQIRSISSFEMEEDSNKIQE